MSVSQYIFLGDFDLRGRVPGGIHSSGFGWKVKQGGIHARKIVNSRDAPEGAVKKFTVCFDWRDYEIANQFLAYTAAFDPESDDFSEEDGADIPLYVRDQDWYYRVWGVVVRPTTVEGLGYIQKCYDVECQLYSQYSYQAIASSWVATSQALSETLAVSNRLGHIPISFDSLRVTTAYSAGLVSALALNFGGDSLTLADNCLTNELWELKGNDDILLETYEDLITAGTQWGHDWTGSGTFDTDHIELNNGQSAYIKLSGPNRLNLPVIMTADLSLDAGGATGAAKVYISEDAVTWIEVLDQDDFESGSAEYSLQGSEYMKNCYVKLYCNSGTSGKYFNVGSIKYEGQRMIPYGSPKVAAGAIATATLTGTGTVSILGTFRNMRKFI